MSFIQKRVKVIAFILFALPTMVLADEQLCIDDIVLEKCQDGVQVYTKRDGSIKGEICTANIFLSNGIK